MCRARGQLGDCSWSTRRWFVSYLFLDTDFLTRMVHTGFLRPSLINHVNMSRIDRNQAEDQAIWSPYPTHRDARPSYLSQYFDEACNLSTIARDISRSMFSDSRSDNVLSGVPRQSREELYRRIRRWHALLPEAFDPRHKPPPQIILLRCVDKNGHKRSR